MAGRTDSGNVNDTDMRWIYNAIVSPANCSPMHMMVRNWFTKRSSVTGRLAFGGYLQVMANNATTTGFGGRNWLKMELRKRSRVDKDKHDRSDLSHIDEHGGRGSWDMDDSP